MRGVRAKRSGTAAHRSLLSRFTPRPSTSGLPSRGRSESFRRRVDAPQIAVDEARAKLYRARIARRVQREITQPVACDAPSAVVQCHVVVAAEQDSSIDIGSPAMSSPLIDVVRFTIGGWSVTAAPAATAVSQRERHPLPGSEQPLLSSDIERSTAVVDGDLHSSRVAGAGTTEPLGHG